MRREHSASAYSSKSVGSTLRTEILLCSILICIIVYNLMWSRNPSERRSKWREKTLRQRTHRGSSEKWHGSEAVNGGKRNNVVARRWISSEQPEHQRRFEVEVEEKSERIQSLASTIFRAQRKLIYGMQF